MEPYTVALTSCGRFDLLERTLQSLLPRLNGPLEKIVIIEDSGDYRIEEVAEKFSNDQIRFEVIVNHSKLGQIRSIDKLLSHVDTEWVFTCEDDWEFIADGFVDVSYALMKEFDSCSAVSIVGHNPSSTYFTKCDVTECGLTYFIADLVARWPYAGYFLGPGLKRMRDYRIVGPFDGLGIGVGEGMIASVYRDLGYRVLQLERRYIKHIGEGRHLCDPARELTGYERKKRSVRRRINKAYWMLRPEMSPKYRVLHRFEVENARMQRWKVW